MCHLAWRPQVGLEAHVGDMGRIPYWGKGPPEGSLKGDVHFYHWSCMVLSPYTYPECILQVFWCISRSEEYTQDTSVACQPTRYKLKYIWNTHKIHVFWYQPLDTREIQSEYKDLSARLQYSQATYRIQAGSRELKTRELKTRATVSWLVSCMHPMRIPSAPARCRIFVVSC